MTSRHITAIIIDDMDLARRSLAAELKESCPEVEIIGEAEGVVSGGKILRKLHPDLIFLDINLEDGSGFDLLEILPDIPSKVVFTTASDAHAIKAFQFSAVDYLLKPIDPELLKKAVQKVLEANAVTQNHFDTLSQNIQTPAKLVLHTAEQVKIADLQDIVRLEAFGNYTYFFFTSGEKLLITKTLKEYNDMLDTSDFLRVHQSHLINLLHLQAYIKTEGGYLQMKDGSRIPVSVRKKPRVLDAIEAYGRR